MEPSQHAIAAGVGAPRNGEGSDAPHAEPLRTQSQHRDSQATGALTQEKRLANLRARCALVGVELHVTTDDRERPLFVGVKWAMCRHMTTLDELAEWVGRIDGRRE